MATYHSLPLSQVCRSAGYYEHALAVSQAANEPEWYLDILLEDCQQYDEALAYLQKLPRQQAAAALTRHGKVRKQCAEVRGKGIGCTACMHRRRHTRNNSAVPYATRALPRPSSIEEDTQVHCSIDFI